MTRASKSLRSNSRGLPSIVTNCSVISVERVMGSHTPGRLRHPSSATVVELLREVISGLMSACIFPPRSAKQTRSVRPTCGAASPAPLATDTVCAISAINCRTSFVILGTFFVFFRRIGFFSPMTMGRVGTRVVFRILEEVSSRETNVESRMSYVEYFYDIRYPTFDIRI